jgi:hypothetical protein
MAVPLDQGVQAEAGASSGWYDPFSSYSGASAYWEKHEKVKHAWLACAAAVVMGCAAAQPEAGIPPEYQLSGRRQDGIPATIAVRRGRWAEIAHVAPGVDERSGALTRT